MRLTAHLYVRLPADFYRSGRRLFFSCFRHEDLAKSADRLEYAGMALSDFIWIRMLITDVSGIQRIARLQDQSAMLVLTDSDCGLCGQHRRHFKRTLRVERALGTPRVVHLLLTVATLIVSPGPPAQLFHMHYAHQHYLHRTRDVTPMIFPEKPEDPGYLGLYCTRLRLRWPRKPPMWPPGQPGFVKSRCYNRLSPLCSISRYRSVGQRRRRSAELVPPDPFQLAQQKADWFQHDAAEAALPQPLSQAALRSGVTFKTVFFALVTI